MKSKGTTPYIPSECSSLVANSSDANNGVHRISIVCKAGNTFERAHAHALNSDENTIDKYRYVSRFLDIKSIDTKTKILKISRKEM